MKYFASFSTLWLFIISALFAPVDVKSATSGIPEIEQKTFSGFGSDSVERVTLQRKLSTLLYVEKVDLSEIRNPVVREYELFHNALDFHSWTDNEKEILESIGSNNIKELSILYQESSDNTFFGVVVLIVDTIDELFAARRLMGDSKFITDVNFTKAIDYLPRETPYTLPPFWDSELVQSYWRSTYMGFLFHSEQFSHWFHSSSLGWIFVQDLSIHPHLKETAFYSAENLTWYYSSEVYYPWIYSFASKDWMRLGDIQLDRL